MRGLQRHEQQSSRACVPDNDVVLRCAKMMGGFHITHDESNLHQDSDDIN